MPIHIAEYLEEAAARFPDKPAWCDKDHTMTYKTAEETTKRIASFILAATNNAQNQPVFVCIDRCIESIALFLGVAQSGNFFVPVDTALPKNRLLSMKETVRPILVLYGSGSDISLFDDVPCFSYEEAVVHPYDPEALSACRRETIDTDPLYCIFTSGSTGVPKGVVKSHRCVISMTECFSQEFGFDETLIVGNQTPFDFDVSYKDIFSALRNAGQLQVLEKALFSSPLRLIERLNERKVNTLLWSVSALKLVSALHTFDKAKPQFLKRVMFSGEVIPCKVLRDWQENVPGCEFVNLYGPTEVAYNCTYHRVEKVYEDQEVVPAGKAFPNVRVFLMHRGKKVQKPGEVGEICISGECLALGYYADSAKTRAAFCQDPTQKAYPQRIYKTGDLGAYDEEGRLIFHGRRDSQIKHLGRRVEMAEIEAAALSVCDLSLACCLYNRKKEAICLFYEAPEPIHAALSKELRKLLPSYMTPTKFYCLGTMPLTRTGKIDRTYLQKTYIDAE